MAGFARILRSGLLLLHVAARPEPVQPTDRRLIAQEVTAWSNYRQQHILPELMLRYNVSVWVVASHEYNEDPAFWSIWPGKGLRNCSDPDAWIFDLEEACFNDQCNRDQVTVFVFDSGTVQRHVLHAWPEVAELIRKSLQGAIPGPRLVLNDADTRFQGMLSGAYRALSSALGAPFLAKYAYDFSSAIPHPLPWEFIELRVPPEADASMLQRYRQLQQTSRAALEFGLSRLAIEPGKTTTEEVNWLMMGLAERELDLESTSSPAVALFRKGLGWLSGPRAVIQEGDMLRSDWGLKGYGNMLWTDNTMLAFVGQEPDPELLAGLAKANRLQELWLESCEWCVIHGCTGPLWVEEIRRRAALENMTLGDENCGHAGEPQCDGAVFSHPIGDFMHSTGPYINSAGGSYGRRRRKSTEPLRLPPSDWRALKVQKNTWFSMELAAFSLWGSGFAEFNLEQQVQITSTGKCEPLLPLQREYLLVAEDALRNTEPEGMYI